MSPKKADPDIRVALIEQAAHLLAEEGSDALTLRRLTNAVGVSTMAVYTHFGSMEELHLAVREEGFARFRSRIEAVVRTDDPVADLSVLGWAYLDNALTNPDLYMAMFGKVRALVPSPTGLDTFANLVGTVSRCMDAGRFRADDPVKLANQLWVAGHGVAMFAIAGVMSEEEAGACFLEIGTNLVRMFAEEPETVDESLAIGLDRISQEPRAESVIPLPDR